MIVALAHRWKGELEEALRAIRESVRLLEPAPGESRTGRLLAYSLALSREGEILGEDEAVSLNRSGEAAECFQRALKIAGEFADRDPSDFQSQDRAFNAERALAGIIRFTEPQRALDLYDDGLRRLAATSANAGTLPSEVETLAASTYPLLRLHRRAEARSRLDAAFDRLRSLKQYPAEQVDLGSPAALTLRALAEYEADGGDVKRGAARYEELLRSIFAADPQPKTSLEEAVDLTNIYTGAARLLRRTGKTDSAAELQKRLMELWQHWDSKLPNNTFVRRQLEAAHL
jgi:tetratricopeptide (TPR) repeat protein